MQASAPETSGPVVTLLRSSSPRTGTGSKAAMPELLGVRATVSEPWSEDREQTRAVVIPGPPPRPPPTSRQGTVEDLNPHLASSRLPPSESRAKWWSEEPKPQEADVLVGAPPPSSHPTQRAAPVPVPPRFRPPMPVHAYTAVYNSKVGTHQQIVGHVEKVGGLAICRMGCMELSDPIASRGSPRRLMPADEPLELQSKHLLLSPRGRMTLRDLEISRRAGASLTLAQMDGDSLASSVASLTRRRPRTAPPIAPPPASLASRDDGPFGTAAERQAAERQVAERQAAQREAYERELVVYYNNVAPPSHRMHDRPASAAAARRRLVLQPRMPKRPWTARGVNGSGFERLMVQIQTRRAAKGAWQPPDRYARGPSSPPIHGRKEPRRAFQASRAAMSFAFGA